MINLSYINRPIEMLPEENRLIRQAKSGDTSAFVQLYDAYVERVYRYIHFLVPNNRVAEGLTFQVFFKAWGQLDRYQMFGSSFIIWLYSVAQNQVSAYYRTHKKTIVPDNDFILAVRGVDFREEFQTIRDGLQILTADQQQALVLKFIVGLPNKHIARVMTKRDGDVRVLQMHALQALAENLEETELRINIPGFQRILEECLAKLSNGISTLDECLTRYPRYAEQLNPLLQTSLLLNVGRDIKPSPTFNAYTHDALIQYVRTHPRQPQIVMPIYQRTALTFTMLVLALLATGTVQAQSALPGDTLYPWKRTSEQVWLAFSFNPVSTQLIIADRRLSELIALANDPTQNADAVSNYLEALSGLESTNDVETLTTIILPALQSQQQALNEAGISNSQLNNYLNEVAVLPIATPIPPTATNIPSTATNIPPTATDVPPTATKIPPTATDVPPTATDIPPTATDVPPTATDVPPTATHVPPTATDVPPTQAPTESPATEEPQSTPTEITP